VTVLSSGLTEEVVTTGTGFYAKLGGGGANDDGITDGSATDGNRIEGACVDGPWDAHRMEN
jgi:Ser-tRNA(Ala) deacylase AlaX